MLLPLSTGGAPSVLVAAVPYVVWADRRGVGLPVRRRFLKLSTSSAALLLPDALVSALDRSSALAVSCGSSVANVRENGLAGTPREGVVIIIVCGLSVSDNEVICKLVAAIVLPSDVGCVFTPP